MKRKLFCFILLICTIVSVANAQYLEEQNLRKQYDKVVRLTDADELLFYVYKGGQQGVSDGNGKLLIPCGRYDKVDYIKIEKNGKQTLFFRIFKNGKEGRCTSSGREIVPPIADKIFSSNNEDPEIRFHVTSNGWEMLYDISGNIIVGSGRYSEIMGYNPYLDGYRVKKNGFEGAVNYAGKELVPPKYSEAAPVPPFKLIRVALNGKMGVCDYNGKELIPPQKYTYLMVQYGKYFEVMVGDKYGVCDSNCREIIPPIYKKVIFEDDKYTVVKDNGMGVFRSDGSVIISPDETFSLRHFPEAHRYIVWKTEDLVGVFDDNGKTIMSPTMKAVGILGDSLIVALKNGKMGLFDINGRVIIPQEKYSGMQVEKYGFVRVTNENHLLGVCNTKGKEIVHPAYQKVSQPIMSDNGKIYFGFSPEGNTLGVFDATGKIKIQPIYEDLHGSTAEGLWAVKKGGKYGFVDVETGSMVVPFEYDSVSVFSAGTSMVYKNGKLSQITNPLKMSRQTTAQTLVKGKAVSIYPAPDSKVDKNIPNGKPADANTHAFIIANENYPVAKVPYALNDGWMFEKYCKQALGIKEENVHLFEDATGGNIMACVEQMKQAAKAASGNATIIFYYAGHAFPDEASKSGYLLPIDGDSKNPATGYSLEKLYKELNSVQTKQVVCFLDACFSGATRDDQMLIAGRGVAIKVKDEIPQGNMVVMTSATGAETAHSYEEMHHGLFTYYLLEKLQQTGGDVTLGELSEHVTKMVKRKSVLINQKKQTPTVIPSPALQGSWQEIRL